MSAERTETLDMAPQYDPAEVEPRWAAAWIERGYFQARTPSTKPAFCIVIPPPNVTGRLHVGHALGRTIEDTLARRARMQGFETLWLPGMDHAGIATQVVVERELRKEGIERRDLGREEFVRRVWEWKDRYGGEIVEQIKRMGASLDWSRERFTMDAGLSRAVREAFVRWYEQGLVYRGERLVNWCPTDRTGLSDSEVEYDDVEGELVTFRYPKSDGSGFVEVATTRVETMLGDTGIAVNPDDDRYRGLVGTTVRHPFDGREIPIVADAAVDPEFGTGAVKVTPAHDPTDFEIAQRAVCRCSTSSTPTPPSTRTRQRSSTGWGATTRAPPCATNWRSSICWSARNGRTSTQSVIATDAIARSSRGSPGCNGSSPSSS